MTETRPGGREPGAAAPAARTWRERWRTSLRWRVLPLLFLGLAIAYVDRANLGAAAPRIQDDLGIGAEQLGLALGVFPLALAATQIPASLMVDRYGPRGMYFFAAIWWSLCTMAVSLVRGIGSLFALRALLGIGESPAYSASLKAASEWFPKRERALASSFYDLGSEFGGAVALPLVTLLIAVFGWRGSFVATGVIGIAWAVWWLASYRTPREHPRLSAEELRYIEDGGARLPSGHGEPRGVRWITLLRYRTVWGLILGFVCRVFVTFFFITWFPSYLVNEHGFTLLETGLLGAIPGLLAIVADIAGGAFSDHLVRRGVGVTRARKIPLVTGMLAASVVGLAAFAPSGGLALALLAVSYCGVAFCTGALWSLPADIAPGPGNVASIAGLVIVKAEPLPADP